ncbi:M28 family metallopeptidase [Paractinoplanes atraurantiacus]|uniref:Peptidase family M28 n=1 Tax=Paractinoplanes atraurantiacus TaxID=1036182 RepID=A0A285KFS9_9ACTN|nr:M28 family metallopeptidase [Actinoplanes atraurantiacus]SNY71482.1 Peptidase family M28 [Actinoplanes atraurantiacus]
MTAERRIHWAVLPSDEAGTSGRLSGHSVRVGDQTLIWSEEEAQPSARVARTGVVASGLSLVTQVGRAFQEAHPDVPVVLDHGRHLVVEGGEALRGKDDTCWRVEPMPADPVVVDRPEPRARRVDPVVENVLVGVARPPYESNLTWISELETRHSLSDGFRQAADRAEMALTTLGYATSRQTVSVGGGQSANVIADRPGQASDRQVVLVTAHLDSVNQAGGTKAPGADDNGSGAAGVLLLASALAAHEWQNDLRLILFGGEEQGLFGSKHYVAGLSPDERGRIRAVLNMDMIGVRNGEEPGVLLEGAPVSKALIDDLAAAAATYTGLRVETSLNPFASDHVPFIVAGVPAVLTIEGNDSANGTIHSANDLLTHIDYGLALEILRMNAAALAGWLRPVEVAG